MSQRILIIEDDAAILRGLEMNFQLEGFETLTARTGRQNRHVRGRKGSGDGFRNQPRDPP